MPKFFVTDRDISDNNITIIGEDVNHIKNVLRLNIGEEIEAEIIEVTNEGNIKLSIKNLYGEKKKKKHKRQIIETSLGFKTLKYKLPIWTVENLKKHKNNSISIDK